MSLSKKFLFNLKKIDEVVTSPKGKKVLIVDRQRFSSVIKNYCAIKILEKRNLLDIDVLTDLDKNSEISKLYNQLGFKSLIKTFNLRYLFFSPLIVFKTFLHFFNYFIFFFTKNFYEFIYNYSVSKIKVGDLIYDRYIRNDYSFLKPSVFDLKLIRIFLYTVFKVYWIEKLIHKKKINLIFVNTHIYSNNYSIAYKLAIKNKINIIYLKDFQITYFKKGLVNKETDPRAITKKKLKNLSLSSKEKTFIKKYMKQRISGKLPHFDVKNAFGSKKNNLNKLLYKKKIDLNDYKKKILLASHSLSDANHFHFQLGSNSPFRDYYTQIIETLNFATKNNEILFFVRPHPSSTFWKEDGIIGNIVDNYNCRNIVLLDNSINTDEAINNSDTVITVYGTIGLETASYYKKKPILAGNSIYSSLGFSLDSNSKEEYFNHILSDKKKYKLNKTEQENADKAFYYYFLKFNQEYKSTIASQIRNLSQEKYCDNFKKFLNNSSLNEDLYFKNLEKILNKIKI